MPSLLRRSGFASCFAFANVTDPATRRTLVAAAGPVAKGTGLATWRAAMARAAVLGLLARGHSNKEIARRLMIAPRTVSSHVEHIYSKIDARSRAAATLFATRHGLVGSYEAG